MKVTTEMNVRVRIQAAWDDATGFTHKLFAEAPYIDREVKANPEDPTKPIVINEGANCTAMIDKPRNAEARDAFNALMTKVNGLLQEAAKLCEKDIDREIGVSIAVSRQVARRMGEF